MRRVHWGGKLQLLSGEACRARWERPGNPARKGRLNLQESAEAIVPWGSSPKGRAERESEDSSWCVREASKDSSQAEHGPTRRKQR